MSEFVACAGTMFAVPSKAVPPIVLAVASLVAVAALPVKGPINDVAVTDPVRLMVPEPLIVLNLHQGFLQVEDYYH